MLANKVVWDATATTHLLHLPVTMVMVVWATRATLCTMRAQTLIMEGPATGTMMMDTTIGVITEGTILIATVLWFKSKSKIK